MLSAPPATPRHAKLGGSGGGSAPGSPISTSPASSLPNGYTKSGGGSGNGRAGAGMKGGDVLALEPDSPAVGGKGGNAAVTVVRLPPSSPANGKERLII